jgi:thioesterase domain-containing protein/acyl carrier protein
MSIELTGSPPPAAVSGAPDESSNDPAPFRGETERRLGQIIADAIGLDELSRDDNYWELGLDSMQAISVIVQIEKRLGTKFTVAGLLEKPRIKDLAEEIDKLKTPDFSAPRPQNTAPTSDPRPKVISPEQTSIDTAGPVGVAVRASLHTPANAPADVPTASPAPRTPAVVAMAVSKSTLAPLFLMHMSGGDLTCYAKLAAHLGAHRSIYGLTPPDGMSYPISLESLAEGHVASILAVQPHGPYYVAGFCFGGLLAYEVARQLKAAGHEVAMLGVIDYPFNIMSDPVRFRFGPASLWKFARNLASWARDLCQLQWAVRNKLIADKIGYARMRLRHAFDPSAPLPGQPIEPCPVGIAPEVWQAHEQAWRQYRPKPYPGAMTLLRLKSLPILQPYDATLGWNRLAARVDVRLISGPLHGDALKAPHVTAFANELNDALIDARKNPI